MPTESSPTVINPPESAPYVQHTEAGLVIKEGMPFETWLAGAPTYEMMFRKAPWWFGDYLIYGDKHYGEEHAQAVSGYTEGHVDNVVSVCARFPVERRQPSLFFSHHKAAASLPPQEADRLLLQGAREHWSLKDISAKVALYHQVNGTKPKRGSKKKAENVHFKVNASAVSEPLTLDGHIEVAPATKLGLFWNGYPIQTKERQVYAPELLSDDEANKVAHHHGLAHSQALVNWLEQNGFIRKEGDEICATNPVTPTGLTTASVSTALSTEKPTVASNGAAMSDPSLAPTPLQLAEYALNDFLNASSQVDWSSLQVLSAKRWLKLLHPVDVLVDTLQDITLKK